VRRSGVGVVGGGRIDEMDRVDGMDSMNSMDPMGGDER